MQFLMLARGSMKRLKKLVTFDWCDVPEDEVPRMLGERLHYIAGWYDDFRSECKHDAKKQHQKYLIGVARGWWE